MNRRTYKLDTEILKRLRLQQGWSQEELASIAGISKKTVERWESGFPGFSGSIKKAADALGVTLDQLIIFEFSTRETLIKHIHDIWIKGVLLHSLRNLNPIDLGLEVDPEAIAQRTALSSLDGPTSDRPHTSMKFVREVFEHANRSLLILGAKGAGKTTVLLHLAHELLSFSRQDHGQPIPVVFNFSSWSSNKPSLTNWLVDELSKRYEVPSTVGRMWIESGKILPLLDDLDQVAMPYRINCIRAIKHLQDEQHHMGTVGLVVCCRLDDYLTMAPVDLPLKCKVLIRPLDREQVEAYLQQSNPSFLRMREVFDTNEHLWQLIDTPLLLNTLPFMASNALQGFGRLPDRPEHLVEDGIESQLEQFAASSPYTKTDATRWLTWLAQALRQNDQSILHLEWIQPDWLQSHTHRKLAVLVALIISGLAVGVVLGIGMQLVLQQNDVLFVCIGFGFVGPFVFGALDIGSEIRPVETLRWSWSSARDISGFRWAGAFLFLSIFSLLGLLIQHLTFGGVLGLFSGLASLMSDISGRTLPTHLKPNQGVHRSVRNGLISGLTGGLIFGMGMFLAFDVIVATVLGLSFGLISGLLNGGHMGIQHAALRILLWRNHLAPLHYVQFLEDAARHGLLRKVGGGYMFAHPSFGEYLIASSSAPL